MSSGEEQTVAMLRDGMECWMRCERMGLGAQQGGQVATRGSTVVGGEAKQLAQRGGRTPNLQIKSLTLYRLS